MESELKSYINCPSCKKGKIVHVGGNYHCNNDKCNFMIPRKLYGVTITKSKMQSLIRNKIIEPMLIGLKIYKGSFPSNGFITLSEAHRIELKYSSQLPVCNCPKCKNNNIIMRYSSKNDSLFYSCTDYKTCKFTLPYLYREKPLTFKNIKRLCLFDRVPKEFKSKNNKKYTANIFLGKKDFKIKSEF